MSHPASLQIAFLVIPQVLHGTTHTSFAAEKSVRAVWLCGCVAVWTETKSAFPSPLTPTPCLATPSLALGNGYLETSVVFYGAYSTGDILVRQHVFVFFCLSLPSKSMLTPLIHLSQENYDMSFAYFLVVAICLAISIIAIIHKCALFLKNPTPPPPRV